MVKKPGHLVLKSGPRALGASKNLAQTKCARARVRDVRVCACGRAGCAGARARGRGGAGARGRGRVGALTHSLARSLINPTHFTHSLVHSLALDHNAWDVRSQIKVQAVQVLPAEFGVSGSLGAWARGSVGAWARGRVGAWARGSVGARARGRVGAWACARVRVYVCVCAAGPARQCLGMAPRDEKGQDVSRDLSRCLTRVSLLERSQETPCCHVVLPKQYLPFLTGSISGIFTYAMPVNRANGWYKLQFA